MKVLIGTPVYQKPEILRFFLDSLTQLRRSPDIDVHYIFIDDNHDKYPESSQLLLDFAKNKTTTVLEGNIASDTYHCDNRTHHWKESIVWKVATYKNKIIQIALKNECDYLFLIDSDLVLNPDTLIHLIEQRKDILSEIFWTKWDEGDLVQKPQVWLKDKYTLSNEKYTEAQFLAQLRVPGIYEVGGLGACTLISKFAMLRGVNFDKINNITIWGEDRHFCIRATCLGLKLWVDTTYPAFHIYRESDLETIKLIQQNNKIQENK